MFIVFEGIDGSGKTSIAKMFAEYLKSLGYNIFLTEEPTKTWIGEAVRKGIKEKLNAYSQAFLFFADRAQHISVIKEHIERGEVVICDRYVYSTYAYQGVQLTEYMPVNDALRWLESIYEPIKLEPDIVFLLTTTPSLGLERIKMREIRENFEREKFLEEVQRIYLMLAEKYGFKVVNSDFPLAQVFEEVKKIFESWR